MARKSMAATQSLSEADKFFIQTKVNEGVPVEKLAEGVGKNLGLVKDFLETLKPKRVKSQYEVARGKQETQGRKSKVAIATQATSQAADEIAKSPKEAFNIRYSKSIAKAKESDD